MSTEVKKISDTFVKIDFECCTVPRYNKPANRDWINWGVKNDYPNFLLYLLKRSSYHGAVVKAKSEYVYGKGLTYNSDELTAFEAAQYDQFLKSANKEQSWNDIFKKNCEPLEVFNGVALEVVWKLNGKCEVYALNPGNFRTNVEGTKYYYCEAWIQYNELGETQENPYPEKHPSFRTFDKFDPQIRTGAQVLFYKVPFLTLEEYGHLYPEANYTSGIQDIDASIGISNFDYNLLNNGMFASSIISLFNGEPEPEEKKKIEKLFKKKFTGSNNAGSFILNFVDKNGTPADVKNLTMSDIDKMFEQLDERLQQKIFVAHRFDPVLAGIKTEGELGGAKEVLEKYDKFLKTYVQHRQAIHLDIIKMFGKINGVNLDKLEVKQTSPVMEVLPIDPNLHQLFDKATLAKYYAEIYGIEMAEQEETTLSALPVNENIKNLKGAEYRRLQNLIAKFKSGKISREEAEHMIKGFGLGDDYINIALGQKFSSQDSILEAFEACAIDDFEGDIVGEDFIHNGVEASEKAYKQIFASTNQSQVLELLKGDPTLTVEKIAKQLGITTEAVNSIVTNLQEKELVTIVDNLFTPTEKGLNTKPAEVEYETVTVYEYVTRPDVPAVESTSRPFCKRLLEMSRNGKRWTKEGIDNISNQFGDDAWTYRGGFYTNPNTQETTPYCRHIWKSIRKVVKKK